MCNFINVTKNISSCLRFKQVFNDETDDDDIRDLYKMEFNETKKLEHWNDIDTIITVDSDNPLHIIVFQKTPFPPQGHIFQITPLHFSPKKVNQN